MEPEEPNLAGIDIVEDDLTDALTGVPGLSATFVGFGDAVLSLSEMIAEAPEEGWDKQAALDQVQAIADHVLQVLAATDAFETPTPE